MVVQSADSVASLSYIDLCNLVVICLTDEIIDAGTIDAGQLLGFRKQRARNDIGGHCRQMAADRANTIWLAIVIYNFKLFADSHILFPSL